MRLTCQEKNEQNGSLRVLLMHLIKLAICCTDAQLPAVTDALVETRGPHIFGPQVKVHILWEGLDAQTLVVQIHLQVQWVQCK